MSFFTFDIMFLIILILDYINIDQLFHFRRLNKILKRIIDSKLDWIDKAKEITIDYKLLIKYEQHLTNFEIYFDTLDFVRSYSENNRCTNLKICKNKFFMQISNAEKIINARYYITISTRNVFFIDKERNIRFSFFNIYSLRISEYSESQKYINIKSIREEPFKLYVCRWRFPKEPIYLQ